MRIRQFAFDDYEAAADLWERAERMVAPPRVEIEKKLERDPDLFLVAEVDDRLVGVVMGTYDGRRGWIFRLAVDPTMRRRGIGVSLVHEVERRCAERGIHHLRLLVFGDNEPALRFWEHLGYERVDGIVMFSKDLSPGDPC
jgi:ribosomal protein S18 acetylase RimI-like enzyme